MTTHVLERDNLHDRVMRRAEWIYNALQTREGIQVRWHEGHLITFRYPAPRSHGTRGMLVAIYKPGALLAWIESDLLEFMESVSDTNASISA